MCFRFARPDFAKLARRARGLQRCFVLALGLTTAFAGCVDLTPPWEGAKQDAESPAGSGGGFVLVDASVVGGSGGDPGPIEGRFPADAPVSSSWDATVNEAGSAGHFDAQALDARVDGEDSSTARDAGSVAGMDGDHRDAERDVSVVGSGGAGRATLDAGLGGAAGGGGTGTGTGGGAGTGTGGGAGTGTGTGTGGTGVCTSYRGRDAGSGISEGQVAYYRCESTAGTTLEDSSGHGHDATLHTGTGGATGYDFITGKVHDALHLVAAQQGYVTLPAELLDNACEATIATWVWIDTSQKWQRVFDFGRDDTIYMFLTPKSSESGKLRFAISLGGLAGEQLIDGTEELPTGAWCHVAVVLGPAGGALYVNGSKVGSNAGLTLRPADLGSLPNLFIGRSQFSKDPYYDGSIDSFRIYDRALSDAEIREVYEYDGT